MRALFPAFILFLSILCFTGCKTASTIGGPIEHQKLTNGVFEGDFRGGPNKAQVRITIEDQKLVKVEILKHDTWKGKKAEPILPQRIVDEQSTTVDAVTGATNSSNVIMNAVQKAIEKSYAAKADTTSGM